MTILGRKSPERQPLPAVARIDRIACPRCATVNCTRHHAAALTTRPVAQHWKGI
ncbi:hypothetical protein [Sphingobium yanoikuyae]|uniref:hypothetical protein n=1 Tax=Sphingobium yanoikuyae TaxID=13690 RepID=UPI000A9EA947|nr:hypothetical protein [Sphingobium yanoikuyae]